MASYDDPEIPDDDYETIKAQMLELGGGMLTLYLPKDWPITERGFLQAKLDVSWADGGWLYVRGWSYEATGEIEANTLAGFVSGPDLPEIDEEKVPKNEAGAPDYEQVTHRASGGALPIESKIVEDTEAFRLWRRIGVLRPDHVRVIEVHLYLPVETCDSDGAMRARHYLELLIPETVFADHITPADRIAPSPTLRKDSFWDTIYLRVPHDWPDAERSEKSDGTHRYVYDDPGPEAKWTLWVDYVAFLGRDANYSGKTAVEFAQRLADRSPRAGEDDARIWVDPMPERPDEAAVKIQHDGIEDGEPLRFISWYKFVQVGRGFIMGQFNWVLIKRAMDEAEIVALTELIETEVLNSVLLDSEAGELDRAPQGSA